MGYILVVDDEEQNRHLLVRRLSKKGYKTLEASDGVVALQLTDSEPIDLVLLDIRMPLMNGNEVLGKIRETFTPADLPVIMVTAETDSASMINSLGLGANDYVTKPIDFPVLLARMENKLAMSKMSKKETPTHENQSIFDTTRVRSIILKGEGNEVEFKSTLRWNIHANKAGKEIEIAWMKTVVAFLNSHGGTLLIGVADDGSILGTSKDRFKNDDKYLLHVSNSIKDSIGLEFISNISYDLVPIDGENVLCILCKPHQEPVFLKNGNDDEFYVRLGPSTSKLNAKEVLAYLQNKK